MRILLLILLSCAVTAAIFGRNKKKKDKEIASLLGKTPDLSKYKDVFKGERYKECEWIGQGPNCGDTNKCNPFSDVIVGMAATLLEAEKEMKTNPQLKVKKIQGPQGKGKIFKNTKESSPPVWCKTGTKSLCCEMTDSFRKFYTNHQSKQNQDMNNPVHEEIMKEKQTKTKQIKEDRSNPFHEDLLKEKQSKAKQNAQDRSNSFHEDLVKEKQGKTKQKQKDMRNPFHEVLLKEKQSKDKSNPFHEDLD